MNQKTTVIFLLFGLIFISQTVSAATAFSCLQDITSDIDFNNNPHHPEKYFFAKINDQKNQFLLMQENKSYLCQTDSNLTYDSSIDIFTMIPDLKEPRRLYYSLSAMPHEKPQTKSSSVPTDGGFLPAHIAMPAAIELANTANGKKNQAHCTKTTDEKLIDKALRQVAENEIQDLYADFADQRDSLAYNYDVKEIDKKKIRKQFDLKLKKLLELCAEVPELKSVTAAVSRKINLKTDVPINITNATTGGTSEKKDKLRSDVKQ